MGTVVSNSGHSLNSIVIGTPGFMPSEQASGRPVYSSDLYALGLTAIYLLTGKTPEMLESDPMTGKIYWRQFALDTNISLAAVLDKTISLRSNERYLTAKEMLDALQTTPSIVATNIVVPAPPPAPTQIISPVTSKPLSNPRTLPEWVKAIIIGSMIGTGILVIISQIIREMNQFLRHLPQRIKTQILPLIISFLNLSVEMRISLILTIKL
jgi:serine/threonine protein kinase